MDCFRWVKTEDIEQEERGTIWAGWTGLGAAEGGGGRRRSRVVGKWEVKRGGTTSLCILWMRGGSGEGGGDSLDCFGEMGLCFKLAFLVRPK